MVRPRRERLVQELGGDLAATIANLQARLEAQENENRNLRAQLEQRDQEQERRRAPPVQPAPQPEPAAMLEMVPQAMSIANQEPLYVRFRRMKPSEFEGSTDPLEAEEWLTSLQTILDFMNLMEQEKVLCASYVLKKDARYWWETVVIRRNVAMMTWNEFLGEFNAKYYDTVGLRAQQNEFNNLKQGDMTVMEACRKFDRLARLCPQLVPTEMERVRRMLVMFRPEIATVVDSGERPPTTVADCVGRVVRAEYHLAQAKEERTKFWDAKKKEQAQAKQTQKGNQKNNQVGQSNQANRTGQGNRPLQSCPQNNQNPNKRKRNFDRNQNFNSQNPQQRQDRNTNIVECSKCGKKHSGVCRYGTNSCYTCSKEGHYSWNCPQNSNR